ncbi:MAG: GyrI-like domain-containing protein [Defluviitaleaceae bacterium]|nr:GyrI-like domain-containing protein [Defluviitaleaceae bacterium]
MSILTNQVLEIENLLTIRFKDKQENIQKNIAKLAQYAMEQKVERKGNAISTTYEVDPGTGEMDMEVYFPIDRAIPGYDNIVFKEKLYLYNCLVIKHKGSPEKVQETYDKLNKYIEENRLLSISSGYNVTINDVTSIDEIDKFEVDVYISVSPNLT